MKKPMWVVAITSALLATNTFGAAATNSVSSALQQGLFEEEANNNLEAAIQSYKAVVGQFDRDRKLAATAIYRLGECYRKQGKTNEAVAYYQRILNEFPDITTTASLSAQNLSVFGMNVAAKGEQGTGLRAAPVTSQEEEEVRRIQGMIENSPDRINAPVDGFTPLQTAVMRGQLVVSRFLLENGASVNLKSSAPSPGETALHIGSRLGHRALVQLLIQHKADVGATDYRGATPLHAAAKSGFSATGEVLLKSGANPNARDSDGDTPLHVAVKGGHQAFAELLLANKADVNAAGLSGATPLHYACRSGHTAIAAMLLKAGAKVDPRGEDGTTLMAAVQKGHLDTVKLLLENKADPNLSWGDKDKPVYPIQEAVYARAVEMAKLLLEHGADPNVPREASQRDNVFPPLSIAVGADVNIDETPEMIALLLKHKADPDVVAGRSGTPLIVAAFKGYERSAQILIQHNANVNATNSAGETALHYSVPQLSLVEGLLDKGANPNAAAKEGQTPLHWAVTSGLTRTAVELIKHGANPNAQDDFGLTPVHYAVMGRNQEMLANLLEVGANPNVRDKHGLTPLDLEQQPNPYSFNQTQKRKGLLVRSFSFNSVPTLSISGGLAVPTRSLRIPQSAQASANPSDISALLKMHGAQEILPDMGTIKVGRSGKSPASVTFRKGTNNWNQFTLIETLGAAYQFLENEPGNTRDYYREMSIVVEKAKGLDFPDLSNVQIRRPSGDPVKWQVIKVNVSEILRSGDCTKDVQLMWGDVIDIPEAEHMLGERWKGFELETFTALNKCWTRKITVVVKGERHELTLEQSLTALPRPPGVAEVAFNIHAYESMWLKPVLQKSRLLLSTSDLSRIKVTRKEEPSKQTKSYEVDCSGDNSPGLWLRDGDVIDVPEKESI